MLASQGSAVVSVSAKPNLNRSAGLAMPKARNVNCRIHIVASAWIPRLIQKYVSSPKCR